MSWFFTVNSISAPLWIALILVAVLLGLNLLVDFGVLVGLNLRKPKAAASAPKSMLPGELTKDLAPRDREFLPAALELLETPPSPIRIAGLWLIFGDVRRRGT